MITRSEFKHLLAAARPRCVKCASLATSVEWTTADGRYPDEAEPVVTTFLCDDHGFDGDSYYVYLSEIEAEPERWMEHIGWKNWGHDLIDTLVSDLRRLAIITSDPGSEACEVYILSDPPLVKIGIAKDSKRRSRVVSHNSGRCNEVVRTWATPTKEDARRIEIAAHRLLAGERKVGEWFEVSADDAVAVVEAAIASDPGPS